MKGFRRLQPLLFFVIFMAVVFAALVMTKQTAWLPALTGLGLLAVMAAFHYLGRPRANGQIASADMSTPLSEANLERLIGALPDPCILLDQRSAIFLFNERAARFIPGLIKNSPLSFHLRWPALNAAIERAMAGETVTVDIEEKVPLERWYTFFITPLTLSNKMQNSNYLCITIHDRTNQMRAERMRVDFVANASHELRTPLASLLGFVETLQGAAKDDEKNRAHFLDIMQRQARRMSRLIDDLLSLSRIEMHAHIQPDTPLDIAALLKSMIDGLKPLAEDRGVTLTLNQPAEKVIAPGDRDELMRAFENLIENAIKYGDDGKKVDITLTPADQPDGLLRVDIRDYGHGIAPEYLPRLTERFYRVDEASSREKGGTGLGLAIVKHILNRHRGQLDIQSRLGQGSVFTAFLPQQPATEEYASKPN
ncbi:MAG: ATP-binding protein [Pseudomonadota bacterium]